MMAQKVRYLAIVDSNMSINLHAYPSSSVLHMLMMLFYPSAFLIGLM
jgi:hypothetical protein